jgi:hypothetical protein
VRRPSCALGFVVAKAAVIGSTHAVGVAQLARVTTHQAGAAFGEPADRLRSPTDAHLANVAVRRSFRRRGSRPVRCIEYARPLRPAARRHERRMWPRRTSPPTPRPATAEARAQLGPTDAQTKAKTLLRRSAARARHFRSGDRLLLGASHGPHRHPLWANAVAVPRTSDGSKYRTILV